MITASYSPSAATESGNRCGTSWPYSCSTVTPCVAAAAMKASAPVSKTVELKLSNPL